MLGTRSGWSMEWERATDDERVLTGATGLGLRVLLDSGAASHTVRHASVSLSLPLSLSCTSLALALLLSLPRSRALYSRARAVELGLRVLLDSDVASHASTLCSEQLRAPSF